MIAKEGEAPLEELLTRAVLNGSACVICKLKGCNVLLWAPDEKSFQSIHERCLKP